MKKLFLLFSFLVSCSAFAIDFYGVYPSNWWTGMKYNRVQLMFYGENVGRFTKVSIPHAGISVSKISRVENVNYLFADIVISPQARAGKFKILLSGGGLPEEDVNYELKTRSKENGTKRIQGINSSDFIYLMIPDRFANGDPSNDVIGEYRDKDADKKNMFSRHGGDFKGIGQHFDYFKELGVTSLWLTPVIENNTDKMAEWGNNIAGYHGYWFTDHYQVDKRLGGNEGYLSFCNTAHQNGLKVIQDAVYNHISKQHFLALDPPANDWINNWPAFTGPSHKEETLFDPYASKHDKRLMLDGWFIDHLPDLNLRNPLLANFLVQHAIWTTEYFGIDGWRVDTYKYCDEAFLNRVNKALENEYPQITIFGEAWVNSPVANAYFTQNNLNIPFKHNANSIIDFQLCFAMLDAASGSADRVYNTLAQDIVYKNPIRNCIFLDNHDMDRAYSRLNEDWNKLKLGLTWLLTLRGIPQLYYGTEVLMKNKKTSLDGASVREDFPGGWTTDPANKFTRAGRSAKEDSAFNYTSTLARFRQTSSALKLGKTTQFVPDNGLYTFFRYDARQTIAVICNLSGKMIKPAWQNYTERTNGFNRLKDVISGKIYSFNEIELNPGDCMVFELLR